MVGEVGFEPTRFLQFGATIRRHQPLGHSPIYLCWWGGWDSNPLSPEARHLQCRAALQLRRLPKAQQKQLRTIVLRSGWNLDFGENNPGGEVRHHPFRIPL